MIVGATSAIAEHCARRWVQDVDVDMTLVGRDKTRIEHVAEDLHVRSPGSTFQIRTEDCLDPQAIRRLSDDVAVQGVPDVVLIAHGTLPDQESCQKDLDACWHALAVTGLSPALYAEAFAHHLAQRGHGTLAFIGSVAGDRGRKSNYIYGAAKGLLDRYAEGLQHRFAGTGVRVVLVKPGPTDTPMTARLKAKGASLAAVDDVAKRIVAAVEEGRPVVYVPSKWRLIMWIIRHLPAPLFNRLDI